MKFAYIIMRNFYSNKGSLKNKMKNCKIAEVSIFLLVGTYFCDMDGYFCYWTEQNCQDRFSIFISLPLDADKISTLIEAKATQQTPNNVSATYLDETSTCSVNVDSKIHNECKEALKSPNNSMFKAAQTQVK